MFRLLLIFAPVFVIAKSICLNMIVRNEAPVIERCLASVKPYIDYWVIVDTGSLDGTQEIIKRFMKDIPGELHERPWVDFGHNRGEALEFAKGKGDYLFFIDADEVFVPPSKEFTLPTSKDCYYFTIRLPNVDYQRMLLINNHLPWKWVGVLHEDIVCSLPKTDEYVDGVVVLSNTLDGYRSRDSKKYLKDAETLEKALIKEPNNTRYMFYLAQSYACAFKYEMSLKCYEKRAVMGGWDQEVYYSLQSIGVIKEVLGYPKEEVISAYLKAFEYRSSRAEPLYYLSDYYFKIKEYALGYCIAKSALSIPKSNDNMFVDRGIYDFGLLTALAKNAYELKWYEKSIEALTTILSKEDLPKEVRANSEQNLLIIKALSSR